MRERGMSGKRIMRLRPLNAFRPSIRPEGMGSHSSPCRPRAMGASKCPNGRGVSDAARVCPTTSRMAERVCASGSSFDWRRNASVGSCGSRDRCRKQVPSVGGREEERGGKMASSIASWFIHGWHPADFRPSSDCFHFWHNSDNSAQARSAVIPETSTVTKAHSRRDAERLSGEQVRAGHHVGPRAAKSIPPLFHRNSRYGGRL